MERGAGESAGERTLEQAFKQCVSGGPACSNRVFERRVSGRGRTVLVGTEYLCVSTSLLAHQGRAFRAPDRCAATRLRSQERREYFDMERGAGGQARASARSNRRSSSA